jgi:hypothetical protein
VSTYPIELADKLAPPSVELSVELQDAVEPEIVAPAPETASAPGVLRLLMLTSINIGPFPTAVPVTVSIPEPLAVDLQVDLAIADTSIADVVSGGTPITIFAGDTSAATLIQAANGVGPPVGATTLTASAAGYESATAALQVLCQISSSLGLYFWGSSIDSFGFQADFGIGSASPLDPTIPGNAAAVITIAVVGFLCPSDSLAPNITGTVAGPQGIGGGVADIQSPSFFVSGIGTVTNGAGPGFESLNLIEVYTFFLPGSVAGATYNSGDTVTIEFQVNGTPFTSITAVPNPVTFTFA